MLIDLFYLLGERMVSVYDRGYTFMAYILIFTAVLLYGFTIYFNVKNLYWFPCNFIVNLINIITITIATILTISWLSRKGSLITSGAISLYLTFSVWSGLSNEKD